MVSSKKKSEVAAPKKAAAPAAVGDVVEVKNISGGIINTSKGQIESGETGKATIAELRSLNKFLEKV